jgi:hypothetical protein
MIEVLIFNIETSLQQQFNPCKESLGNRYFAVPNDNTKFIQCATGRAYRKQCPQNLIWSDQLQTCIKSRDTDQLFNMVIPKETQSSTREPTQAYIRTAALVEFSFKALKAHNKYRELHGVPPLVLNTDLSQLAQIAATNSSFERSRSRYNGVELGESFLGSSTTNTGK